MDDVPTNMTDVRRALDEIERSTEAFLAAIDDDDLDAAGAALEARAAALSRAESAASELSRVGAGSDEAMRAVLGRIIEGGRRLEDAADRAQRQRNDGIRQVRSGCRLTEQQRLRGRRSEGSWCDVTG